jgi:hypothetical protein
MRWFRLHADAIDDDKLKLLAFEDRWHFVAIMCLKAQGVLDNADKHLDRRVAAKLGVTQREADEIRNRLMDIELIGQDWQPVNWDKRQYVSDNSTERVRKYRRKRQRETQCNVSGTPPETEADSDAETETESPDADAPDGGETPPTDPPSKTESKSRGSRLPEDWELPDEYFDWAHDEAGLTPEAIRAIAAKFYDYWISVPGAKGRKSNWLATWRNWIRRELENSNGQRGRQSTGGLSAAERVERANRG